MNTRIVGAMIAWLLAVEAVAFGAAALIHAGVQLPLGITEPATRSAAAAEALVSVLFAICAVAIVTRRNWARRAAFLAHGVAIAAVMMGMANLALGQATRSIVNDYFYRVMLLVAMLMLVFLLTSTAAAALARGKEPARSASPDARAGPR